MIEIGQNLSMTIQEDQIESMEAEVPKKWTPDCGIEMSEWSQLIHSKQQNFIFNSILKQ